MAITLKWVNADVGVAQLMEQLREDAEYYRRERKCRVLLGFIYDPEMRLPEPMKLEAACSIVEEEMQVRCVVSG